MARVEDVPAELLLLVMDLMDASSSLQEWVNPGVVYPAWKAVAGRGFEAWIRRQPAGSSFGYSVVGAAEAAFLRERCSG